MLKMADMAVEEEIIQKDRSKAALNRLNRQKHKQKRETQRELWK